ncbi:acyl-CoA reductase [Flavobacteriaceae bacterium M23B6Z8]
MSKLRKRLTAFVKLGDFLRFFSDNNYKNEIDATNAHEFQEKLNKQIDRAALANGWFTKENIRFTLKHWGDLLTEKNLNSWISSYTIDEHTLKNVAIVMAGNIPLVGFHDFLCVLLTGHNVLVKQSSSDQFLLPLIAKYLVKVEPDFNGAIEFTEKQLEKFDAVIATGSDNTARYFEYYFKNKPHIIRKNRNSVGIITGNESQKELEELGEDIFRYFGLGCRSVSKLFVPSGYDFDIFFKAVFQQKDIIDHHKYANNYDYNKAVYLMSLFEIKDNGFLLLKEDEAYASPIATVFYEFYDSKLYLEKRLEKDRDKIQCIVSSDKSENHIPFGESQKPQLDSYADGVDTVDFLLKIPTNKY